MANIKASKKDILTNKRNKDRNVAFKSKMKTAVKKAVTSISEKTENAETLTRTALKTIDKLAAKGILHKKTAARKKSNLMKKVNNSANQTEVTTETKKAKKATESKKAAPAKTATKAAPKKAKTTTKAATETKTKSAKKPAKKSA